MLLINNYNYNYVVLCQLNMDNFDTTHTSKQYKNFALQNVKIPEGYQQPV